MAISAPHLLPFDYIEFHTGRPCTDPVADEAVQKAHRMLLVPRELQDKLTFMVEPLEDGVRLHITPIVGTI